MAYTPTTWVDSPSTASPIDATHLNHAETGIQTAQTTADAAATAAAAANAYSDAKAITGVQSTATSNFTAAVAKVSPVDATSGNVTVTLPSATGNGGGRLVITRTDASANTVTVTGTIRGVSSSITLTMQNEAVELVSNGTGSWWPVADHKTLATLDARYSTVGVAEANYSTLIPFYAALANRQNGRCDIVIMGDSLPEGYPATSWERTISGWMQQLMRQRFKLPDNPTPSMPAVGNARGFVGIPSTALQAAGANNPFTWTFTGGTQNDVNGFGTKFSARVMTAAGNKAVLTVPTGGLTSFEIHFTQATSGNGGGATNGYYKIDGGSAVVFSTLLGSGSFAAGKLVVSSPVTTSIEVGLNAGSGLSLSGIYEFSNTESASFSVHNCGIGGARASTWSGTNPTGGWSAAMALLNPDLIVIMLGGNEFLNAVASSTFKTNMTSLVAVIRAAGMTCPIILSLPYNGTPIVGGGEPLSAYVTAAKQIVAADPTLLVLDNSVRMPATFAANTYNLYHTDGIHGNANGNAYELMAEALAATVAPN